MKTFFVTVFFCVSLVLGASAQQSAVSPATAGTTYGKEITSAEAQSVAAVAKELDKKDKFTGKLEGKVERVCTTKGCWLSLKTVESDKPVVVRFKDYGFFVPQDIVGKTVVVDGYAKMKEKENEQGEIIKDITFTADGVLVVK